MCRLLLLRTRFVCVGVEVQVGAAGKAVGGDGGGVECVGVCVVIGLVCVLWARVCVCVCVCLSVALALALAVSVCAGVLTT